MSEALPFRLTVEERRLIDSVAEAEERTKVDLLREMFQQRAEQIRTGLRGPKRRIRMMVKDVERLKKQLAELPDLDELNEKLQVMNSTIDQILRKLEDLPGDDYLNSLGGAEKSARYLNEEGPDEDYLNSVGGAELSVRYLKEEGPDEDYLDSLGGAEKSARYLNEEGPDDDYMGKVIEAANAALKL